MQSSEVIFRKVCKRDETAVRFAGWTIDKGFKRDSEVLTGDNKEYLVEVKPKKSKVSRVKLPRSLDIHTWAVVSEQFATEKLRVFQSLGMVWRKFILIF